MNSISKYTQFDKPFFTHVRIDIHCFVLFFPFLLLFGVVGVLRFSSFCRPCRPIAPPESCRLRLPHEFFSPSQIPRSNPRKQSSQHLLGLPVRSAGPPPRAGRAPPHCQPLRPAAGRRQLLLGLLSVSGRRIHPQFRHSIAMWFPDPMDIRGVHEHHLKVGI